MDLTEDTGLYKNSTRDLTAGMTEETGLLKNRSEDLETMLETMLETILEKLLETMLENIEIDTEITELDKLPEVIDSLNPDTTVGTQQNTKLQRDLELEVDIEGKNIFFSDHLQAHRIFNTLQGTPESSKWGQKRNNFDNLFLEFGKYDQSDRRFSKETRGNQCTCNCLVYLAMAVKKLVKNLDLNYILDVGDNIYMQTVQNLKKNRKISKCVVNFGCNSICT